MIQNYVKCRFWLQTERSLPQWWRFHLSSLPLWNDFHHSSTSYIWQCILDYDVVVNEWGCQPALDCSEHRHVVCGCYLGWRGVNHIVVVNEFVLSTPPAADACTCDCRRGTQCFFNGFCLDKNLVYKATVTRSDNNHQEFYTGVTAQTMKGRYNGPLYNV